MKNWVRVIIVSSFLVGGTGFFAHLSFKQLDNELNNLSASYLAAENITSTFLLNEIRNNRISTTTLGSASSTATTSATSTDVSFAIVFPPKNEDVYIGCSYQVPLVSSTTIRSLETALIDAGTGEATGPIASGLAKENSVDASSQSFIWKIGAVWPGEYVISVSKIDGVEASTKSKYFVIDKIPEGISALERGNLCKESGGLL